MIDHILPRHGSVECRNGVYSLRGKARDGHFELLFTSAEHADHESDQSERPETRLNEITLHFDAQ